MPAKRPTYKRGQHPTKENIEQLVRERAYSLYQQRCQNKLPSAPAHATQDDDWHMAETQIKQELGI